jgi:ubiquinone biosynthesis protein UbiJ
MIIKKLLDLINNLISRDIKHLKTLQELQDVQLHIEVFDLNISENIYFSQSGLSLDSNLAKNFSSIDIQGDLKSFLSLIISQDPKRASQQGLVFAGDPKALQHLQHLLRNVGIDWEAQSPAHHTKLETLSMSISDYLKYEKNLVPTLGEIESFMDEVDQIRSAVERCEARINAVILNAGLST